MASTLNTTEKSRLARADRTALIAYLATLKSNSGSWTAPGQHYPTGELPFPCSFATLSNPQKHSIANLVAISGPNHCIDGWGFLARAIASLTVGDMHSARHFGYYAELRAALSLLAAHGIGIFDSLTVAVDATGTVHEVSSTKRTHVITWLALEHWATLGNAGSSISSSLIIRGVTLEEFLKTLWPGASTRPTAKQLVLDWGVDLQDLLKDKFARNTSSYAVQNLNRVSSTPSDVLDYVIELWQAFEPTPAAPFQFIDRHLFRLAAETQLASVGGTNLKAIARARYGALDPAIQSVISEDFLVRDAERDDLLPIRQAKAGLGSIHPVALVSRAALLLRSATAASVKLLVDAGIDATRDLAFWYDDHGKTLGFWDQTAPTSMSDLWVDVSEALQTAQQLRTQSSTPFSQYAWMASTLAGLPRIFEAERIAFWGLCT